MGGNRRHALQEGFDTHGQLQKPQWPEPTLGQLQHGYLQAALPGPQDAAAALAGGRQHLRTSHDLTTNWFPAQKHL